MTLITHKEIFSLLLLYIYYFMIPMWPCILIDRKICWVWILRTSSSQCHNTQVLFPPRKLPDHVKDLYDGHTYHLKTRVDIWMRMDVVPLEYGTFAHTFHLKIWFFQFMTGITFKWYYVMCRILALFVWIGILNKMRIYRVPPDPVRWSCRGFGFLWEAVMLNCMLWTNDNLKISHRKQFNASSNKKLATYLVDFECQSFGIFEILSAQSAPKKPPRLVMMRLERPCWGGCGVKRQATERMAERIKTTDS